MFPKRGMSAPRGLLNRRDISLDAGQRLGIAYRVFSVIFWP